MRILLVEDDELLGDGIRNGLVQYGYTVDWIKDGLSAQLAITQEPFDVIILDIFMPELDGFAVHDLLKKNDVTASIPVIFISGEASDEVEKKCRDRNAPFLSRPFEIDEMLSLIDSAGEKA